MNDMEIYLAVDTRVLLAETGKTVAQMVDDHILGWTEVVDENGLSARYKGSNVLSFRQPGFNDSRVEWAAPDAHDMEVIITGIERMCLPISTELTLEELAEASDEEWLIVSDPDGNVAAFNTNEMIVSCVQDAEFNVYSLASSEPPA
jgi:hypothetical protein